MRALISVYDKTNLIELASGLKQFGYELMCSGGTSNYLEQHSIAHIKLEDITGFSELLSGRVKTLHPYLYASILADLNKPEHLEDLNKLNLEPISIVVCNLYPFSTNPSIELIDIGGPSMVRAAAKNYEHVTVVTSPDDYADLLSHLSKNSGKTTLDYRLKLASKAFDEIASYDQDIASWFLERQGIKKEKLADKLNLNLSKIGPILKYGENPHQQAALYIESGKFSWVQSIKQFSGRELSYLNIYDSDSALRLAFEISDLYPESTAVVIVKHANPTGAAFGEDPPEVFKNALAGDEVAAFGGICALTCEVDETVADAIAEGPQLDVILAPSFTEKAISILVNRRKATRILSVSRPVKRGFEIRSLDNAYLIQEPDFVSISKNAWQLVTTVEPSPESLRDAELAYLVCARTTSNAIVLAKNQAVVGVGAGQQSRVDACEIAVKKARDRAFGSACASDAFFPFTDGVKLLADAGCKVIVQPGGSMRDKEVIQEAESRNIAMLLTGQRHFRH